MGNASGRSVPRPALLELIPFQSVTGDLMRFTTICAALIAATITTSCGSAANNGNESTAALAAFLLSPACSGVCYEFSDSTGITVGPGLSLSGGQISGTGFFNINAAVVPSEPLVTVVFSLQTGGSMRLSTGNPATAGSAYFDNTADGNRFSVTHGTAGSARDKGGNTDTMTSAVTPASSTALTYCYSWHVHNASEPLHMTLWTNCASTASAGAAYSSSDATKIVGGVTTIKNAGQTPVSGALLGFELDGASIDRVIVQAK